MNRFFKTLAGLSFALAAATTIPVHAEIVSVSAENFGWVNSSAEGNGGSPFNNTFTGNTNSRRYNSWASFTIPTLSGSITSVSLSLFLSNYNTFSNQTINIFDVNTPFNVLNSHQSQVGVYNDLMTGDLYGSFQGLQGNYSVSFAQNAYTDILNSSGNIFVIGFTNATTNALPVASNNGIYTNGNGGPTLTITTGQSVPEPATIALFGLGLLGAAAARRAKKLPNKG